MALAGETPMLFTRLGGQGGGPSATAEAANLLPVQLAGPQGAVRNARTCDM